MIDRCPICDANLAMVGKSHRCVAKVPKTVVVDVVKPKSKNPARLDGGVRRKAVTGDGQPIEAVRTPKGPATATNPKLGRPRKGEERDKPWLKCNPPLSRTTWYRRQKEKSE